MTTAIQPSFAQLYDVQALPGTSVETGSTNSGKGLQILFIVLLVGAAFYVGLEIGKQVERKMWEELKRKNTH